MLSERFAPTIRVRVVASRLRVLALRGACSNFTNVRNPFGIRKSALIDETETRRDRVERAHGERTTRQSLARKILFIAATLYHHLVAVLVKLALRQRGVNLFTRRGYGRVNTSGVQVHLQVHNAMVSRDMSVRIGNGDAIGSHEAGFFWKSVVYTIRNSADFDVASMRALSLTPLLSTLSILPAR